MPHSVESNVRQDVRGSRRKRRRSARRSTVPAGRKHWLLGFRGALPLLLVCLTLLGSVAIPARQTWLITHILRETVEGLAPARLVVEQLQSGLGSEFVTLQSYAISGDDSLIGEYHALAAADDGRVATLRGLVDEGDALSLRQVDALDRHVEAWHDSVDGILARRDDGVRGLLASSLGNGTAAFDSSMTAIMVLSEELATLSDARDERVSSLEKMSIVVNAALVLAAMVAMAGVLMLTLRERRLTAGLERALRGARGRARREAALREAAEALAGVYTREEVTQRIVLAALRAMRARGAFVARIVDGDGDSREVVVRAVMGDGALPLGARRAFEGSYTRLVTEKDEPILVPDLVALEPGDSFGGVPYPGGSAIVLPLTDGAAPVGALFVLSSTKSPFRHGSVARADIFAHLATLAYEKVRLLEEAHERRRALERVVQSRSRLMRGFSHDVKNPIGAADGFAELLLMGLYGDLNDEQRGSVERMRRGIRTALELIADLHELARAETGMVALARQRVDLAELVRSMGEEYHAVAAAGGLSLTVSVDCDDAVVETDRARVLQIAGNLLSNAIKYTEHGGVEVRVASTHTDVPGEAGRWALLEVIDSGIGIAPAEQELIFDEFRRGGGGSGDRAGAGLGLAISRLLAQALGGRITVSSAEGRGSTFTLWLPMMSSGL